jgi:hypothetical protein
MSFENKYSEKECKEYLDFVRRVLEKIEEHIRNS